MPKCAKQTQSGYRWRLAGILIPHSAKQTQFPPRPRPKCAKQTQFTIPTTKTRETNPIYTRPTIKNAKRTQLPPRHPIYKLPPTNYEQKNAKRTQFRPRRDPVFTIHCSLFTHLRNEPNSSRPKTRNEPNPGTHTVPPPSPSSNYAKRTQSAVLPPPQQPKNAKQTQFHLPSCLMPQKCETNPIPVQARSRHAGMPPLCETNPIYHTIYSPQYTIYNPMAQFPANPSPQKDLQQNHPRSGQTASPADLNGEQYPFFRLKGKLQCSDEYQNTISTVLALSGPRDWTAFKVFLDFPSPTLIV